VGIAAARNPVGFVAGAGVEARINALLSIGVEGLYYGFKHNTDAVTTVAGLGPGRAFIGSDDNSTFVLRSRVSFHLPPQ
jgi:hypothetical protein